MNVDISQIFAPVQSSQLHRTYFSKNLLIQSSFSELNSTESIEFVENYCFENRNY